MTALSDGTVLEQFELSVFLTHFDWFTSIKEPILEVVNEMCSSPMTISNSCRQKHFSEDCSSFSETFVQWRKKTPNQNQPAVPLCQEAAKEHRLLLWSHCRRWFSSAPPSHSYERTPGLRKKTKQFKCLGDLNRDKQEILTEHKNRQIIKS